MLAALVLTLLAQLAQPSQNQPPQPVQGQAQPGAYDLALLRLWQASVGATLVADTGQSITFTRSSSKECSAGLSLATTNAPCIETAGLNMETATTNSILRGQAFSQGSWSGLASGVAVPTATDNSTDVTSPAGATDTVKLVFPAVSGSNYSVYNQAVVTAAGPFTFSTYFRTLTGTATLYLARGDGFTEPVTACAITTAWSRCYVTMTNTAASHNFMIGVNLLNAGETAKAAQTVYVRRIQLEPGSLPTSAILTAGTSASRAADHVDLGPLTLAANNQVSISADVLLNVPQTSESQAIIFAMYANGSDQFHCYLGTAQLFACSYYNGAAGGGPSGNVSTTFVAGISHHVSVSYNGATLRACVDSTCQSASTVFTFAGTAATHFTLMGDGLGNNGAIGTIKNVCFSAYSFGCN